MKTKAVAKMLAITFFFLVFLIAPLSSASAGTSPDVRINMEILSEYYGTVKTKIEAFTDEITQPYDPVGGGASGNKVHDAVHILKKFNEISPYFSEWLVRGERLVHVVFRFTKMNLKIGKREHFYTITLQRAYVVKQAYEHAAQSKNAYETVAFTYQRIDYTDVKSGLTRSVDW